MRVLVINILELQCIRHYKVVESAVAGARNPLTLLGEGKIT